jgi:4-hydroxybutyrate CoA-transferase
VLLGAIAAVPEASDGVHYLACLIPGVNRVDPAAFHPRARLTSLFVHPDIERSYAAGRVRFMPLHYSGFYDYLARHRPIDVALIQVGPPHADGYCSVGPCVDFAPAVLDDARLVVAEVNRALPAPPGAPRVAWERLDRVVEVDHPLVTLDSGALSGPLQAVGEHVASLVEDGDVIQAGIGKLPAAILARLADRRDLGLHGGMITDEVADLAEAGVVNGARKSVDRGLMVCGVALGSERLYAWSETREDLVFRPVGETHDVRRIAAIDRFVSINSVLEVDLTGQGNAEVIGARQVSGTGGLLDYVRGARLSRGGRSILALASTAGGGKVSRIKPVLEEGAVVSCPRADVDYVVTEHGIASLRDCSIDERAEALIAVADPTFRAALIEAWERRRARRARA